MGSRVERYQAGAGVKVKADGYWMGLNSVGEGW